MYKLITFDITGTILKLRYPVGEIYSEVAKCFGIECNPPDVTTRFKSVWKEMNDQYPNYGLSKGLGWENWWKQIVIKTLECCPTSSSSPKESFEKTADKLISLFGSEEGWELNEGAADLLTYLKDKGTFVGAISNFDPRLHGILKAFPETDVFKFVITSYEAKVLKPDPKIFHLAEEFFLKHCGTPLDKTKAIHVGDCYSTDAAGAINAGWNFAIINPKTPPGLQENNYSNLIDFRDCLEQTS